MQRPAYTAAKAIDEALGGIGMTREQIDRAVWDQLGTCYDPEIPVSIVDLGLIYSCELETLPSGGHKVAVRMTLTAPGCPVAGEMPQWVEKTVNTVQGLSGCKVNMVFEPPWDQSRMSEEARVALDMW